MSESTPTQIIERALSRLTVGRGGPRDLAALRDALALAPRLRGSVVVCEEPITCAPGGSSGSSLA